MPRDLPSLLPSSSGAQNKPCQGKRNSHIILNPTISFFTSSYLIKSHYFLEVKTLKSYLWYIKKKKPHTSVSLKVPLEEIINNLMNMIKNWKLQGRQCGTWETAEDGLNMWTAATHGGRAGVPGILASAGNQWKYRGRDPFLRHPTLPLFQIKKQIDKFWRNTLKICKM